MSDDVHRTALRATAKVALSLTVISCGGRVEIQGASSEASSEGGAPALSSTTTSTSSAGGAIAHTSGAGGFGGAPGGSGPGVFCEAVGPAEPVTLDPEAFGCCVEHLSAQPTASWQTPSEEMVACCHEVVGQIDQEPTLAAQIDETLVAPVWPQDDTIGCCEVLGNPCTQPCGCTVWGPPVPYRLAGRLPMLDELGVA